MLLIMSTSKDDKSIFTRESNNSTIHPSSILKVYEYKDCPDVSAIAMTNHNKPTNNWRKISKNESINIETGELRTYDSCNSVSRSDNSQNIRRSQQRLVHLIRNNFSNPKQLKLHSVLTFRVPVYDYDVAMEHWKTFSDRLRHRFPLVEYIAIFEYYEKGKNKGAIHIHLLLLPNYSNINRDVIRAYWNYGFVYLKEFTPDTATYFVKSKTLHLYPKGKRLYTKSKGIIMPTPKEMKYSTFISKMTKDNFECSSQKSIDIVSKDKESERVVNTISYLNYKKKEGNEDG